MHVYMMHVYIHVCIYIHVRRTILRTYMRGPFSSSVKVGAIANVYIPVCIH